MGERDNTASLNGNFEHSLFGVVLSDGTFEGLDPLIEWLEPCRHDDDRGVDADLVQSESVLRRNQHIYSRFFGSKRI